MSKNGGSESTTFFCFMRPHGVFDIEWINFPDTKRVVRGCYLIGGCYVGASKNIRSRILSHISKVFSTTNMKFNSNYKKTTVTDYIEFCLLFGLKIEVTFLSPDTSDEEKFYKEYNMPIYPSTTFYNQIYKDEIDPNVKPKKL